MKAGAPKRHNPECFMTYDVMCRSTDSPFLLDCTTVREAVQKGVCDTKRRGAAVRTLSSASGQPPYDFFHPRSSAFIRGQYQVLIFVLGQEQSISGRG